jgi:AraC family transcriptional regulator of adaptative response/methylated-DNA-[protein]-cysteine methyltransferase
MNAITTSHVHFHFRDADAAVNGPVQYAIGSCAQGQLLVARGQEGICAIFMGDSVADLQRQIAESFPDAELIPTLSALQFDLRQVAQFIDQPDAEVDFDLSVGGTEFQQRIWKVLREIPAGQTWSYADVAERVGSPNAVRAVASACAANLLAVAIPCHRVVRSDGSLSGYRWGIDRKRSLLQRERQ